MTKKKFFLWVTLIFLNREIHAAPICKVYGISDGPQNLSCEFSSKKMELQCINGKYFLDRSLVTVAYHLEVESGSNPLVFKTDGLTLTVTLENGMDKAAELETLKGTIIGVCKKF